MALALPTHNSSGLAPSTLHSPQPRQVFLPPFIGAHILLKPVVVVLVPAISVAAFLVLRNIFTKIADLALTVWASFPPYNQVVIEAGMMRLEFGCAMQPVPMTFVAEFAISRRDAVDRGFAEVFAKEWWWNGEDRERVCYVGVRYVGEGGTVVAPPE